MRYTDIPEEFLSYETGEPFKSCKVCDRDLTDPSTHYIIEKAIRRYPGYEAYDVVFEYAICYDCAEGFRKELSVQSLNKIEQYFINHVDVNQHASRLQSDEPYQPDQFTSNCLVKGLNKNEIEEYQIYGECRGNKLVYGNMPYMISGPAMDEIAQLLSNQTLDELDGFAGKHLGPSPELENLFRGRKLVLL